MLILLPPSEGKTAPKRGKPLDVDTLAHPELTPTREKILDALIDLCSGDAGFAAKTLGLGRTQMDQVARNEALRDAPTARADRVYTGVLFAALDLGSLEGPAKRRANQSIAITSGLFGLVRPGDRIPAYRLSGDVSLPATGPVAGMWRDVLGPVIEEADLLVDLRSAMYVNLHKPAGSLAKRTATLRVLHEHNGQRKVVSHFNKAAKGRIVRALLTAGAAPRTVDQLADVLGDLGWTVERDGHRLDVVVDQVQTH